MLAVSIEETNFLSLLRASMRTLDSEDYLLLVDLDGIIWSAEAGDESVPVVGTALPTVSLSTDLASLANGQTGMLVEAASASGAWSYALLHLPAAGVHGFENMISAWAIACVLMLLAGTAFAATVVHGVTYFLTDRTTHPIEINPDLLMSNLTQSCTSEWLNATVQDAYWDGTELSVSIHVTPKDSSIPFAMLYDIGLDGESFDTIWLTDADFNSNIMPVEQWRDGKTGILLCYPKVTLSIAGTEDTSWRSLDYVHIPEENAVVLMLQMPVNSLTAGGQMVIRLDASRLQAIGYKPSVGMEEMFRRTIRSMRERI